MREFAHRAREAARAIQREAPRHVRPPEEGEEPSSERVLPLSIVRGTRGYIERIANQINGTYEKGWFDACAVMMRRMIETLLIEALEHQGIAHKAQDSDGNFVMLEELIKVALSEPTWNLSRDTKRALPKIKHLGDKSAHARRFNAHRGDVEKVADDARAVVQELVYLANLR